jgi:hypothetical protein
VASQDGVSEIVIRPISGGVTIDVRVIPRARRSEIGGTRGQAVLVRLKAPPVDGAANAELIDVIASKLHVAKNVVSLVTGEHSRQKRLKVVGLDAATVQARLNR